MKRMITEKVYSPYEDKDIHKHVGTSDIWNKAFKEDELTKEVKAQYQYMFMYRIKFDGLTPVQVLTKKMVKFK